MPIGIVKTTLGPVQGVDLDGKYEGITLFKGIPYAAPPIGELRWRPPADADPWEDVRICDKYGDAAFQSLACLSNGPSLVDDDYYYDGWPPVSEDCLYLNIYTGAKGPGEKRPVYLWFHGGGLNQGYSYEPEFDGSEMARKGAVVVQVGQRLNVFGWMCLPQLTAEGSTGNYGLMDEIKALNWVIDNIEAFGGDPQNITAGGESGGSWKATTLATCPLVHGKVQKVIGESWLNWFLRFPTLEESEKIGTEYLKTIGIDPDISVDELRKMDARMLYPDGLPRYIVPGDECCDGVLIPYPTHREIYEHYGSGIDYLGGCNLGQMEVDVFSDFDQEYYSTGHYFIAETAHKAPPHPDILETANAFYSYYKGLLGDLYYKYDFESLIPVTDDTAWITARRIATLGLTPVGRRNINRSLMTHRLFGEHMTKKDPQSKTFVYMFSQLLPARPEDKGTFRDPEITLSWHGCELYYAFDSMREGRPLTHPWREEDYRIADIMSSYWVNFMKNGDPNGEDLPYWPATGDDLGYMEINSDMQGHRSDGSKLDELIREYITAIYDLDV